MIKELKKEMVLKIKQDLKFKEDKVMLKDFGLIMIIIKISLKLDGVMLEKIELIKEKLVKKKKILVGKMIKLIDY